MWGRIGCVRVNSMLLFVIKKGKEFYRKWIYCKRYKFLLEIFFLEVRDELYLWVFKYVLEVVSFFWGSIFGDEIYVIW